MLSPAQGKSASQRGGQKAGGSSERKKDALYQETKGP
ncbi:hypothetical protein AQF52_0111 [Streptomyces venezuelae]|nr:hypothetical protein AQF52_0111 [Streptomyces venezuelae]